MINPSDPISYPGPYRHTRTREVYIAKTPVLTKIGEGTQTADTIDPGDHPKPGWIRSVLYEGADGRLFVRDEATFRTNFDPV